MSEQYFSRSTSFRSSEIDDQMLTSNSVTRLVLRPKVVDNSQIPEAGVRVTLARQRKSPRGSWNYVPTKPLSSLKMGEEAQLNRFTASLAGELV